MKPYTVVDSRGNLVYIGPHKATARWHLDRDNTYTLGSSPYHFFRPGLFKRFIRFIIGLISRLLLRRS